MSAIQVIGTIFGLLCVWLTARESIWNFPAGIVNIVLFGVMFMEARLYAEIITYSVFFVMNVVGWWAWLRAGPDRTPLTVRRLSRGGRLAAVGAVGVVGPALGAAFAHWTDAALPYLDSTITAASVVAQALLTYKVLENWLFWIFVDVLGIGVYWARGLYLTSGLYAVFLVLSVLGWRNWRGRC